MSNLQAAVSLGTGILVLKSGYDILTNIFSRIKVLHPTRGLRNIMMKCAEVRRYKKETHVVAPPQGNH